METRSPDEKCPRCGKVRAEWRSDNSEGVIVADIRYCCEGCANNTGCVCAVRQTPPRLEKNVLDVPDAKAKGLE